MQIEFRPSDSPENHTFLKPVPAITLLPDWYKAKKPFIGNDKAPKVAPNGLKNITIKWCNPFGDALGAGYYIVLENDIQVTPVNGSFSFVWNRGGADMITEHSAEQISPEIVPDGFSQHPWKFKNYWSIKTPKGYSCLFTHPLNRPELPFYTLAGIVETDTYTKEVQFPFLLRENFEGILKAGTPIVQVIPFKRDNWSSKFNKYNAEFFAKLDSQLFRFIARGYKTLFHVKKVWK